MCFSVSASFIASSLLTVIGTVTLFSIRSKRYYLFACMPLFFGIQQFCEGCVWLGLLRAWQGQTIDWFGYGFLFFAYGVWPFWVPLSLYYLEPTLYKKKILFFFACAGSVLALISASGVFLYGIKPAILDNHIVYNTSNYGTIINYVSSVTYLVVTIGSFFLVTGYLFNFFGLLLLASCAASYYFWQTAFASTWCFFAAMLSVCMYALVALDYPRNKDSVE